jgi:hypothetical protein
MILKDKELFCVVDNGGVGATAPPPNNTNKYIDFLKPINL